MAAIIFAYAENVTINIMPEINKINICTIIIINLLLFLWEMAADILEWNLKLITAVKANTILRNYLVQQIKTVKIFI